MLTAKVDTAVLEKKFKSLRANEIPTAARNTLNDLMRDSIKHEQLVMGKTFDRPKPYIVKGLRLNKSDKVTKTKLNGSIHFLPGARTETLKPHIPGFRKTRGPKLLEEVLRKRGVLKETQYLVPSRSMKRDKYGNVSKKTLDTMASDLVGLGRGKRDRFIWATVHGKKGDVSGIWYRTRIGKGSALAMLAVDDEPTYNKRYRFYDSVRQYAGSRMAYHAELAVHHAIRRRYGR